MSLIPSAEVSSPGPVPGPSARPSVYSPLPHVTLIDLPTAPPTTLEEAEAQAGVMIYAIQRAIKLCVPASEILKLKKYEHRLLHAIDDHSGAGEM